MFQILSVMKPLMFLLKGRSMVTRYYHFSNYGLTKSTRDLQFSGFILSEQNYWSSMSYTSQWFVLIYTDEPGIKDVLISFFGFLFILWKNQVAK